MEEKYQQLLDRQIDKLAEPDFDLEAWKSGAKYVLRIIFGPDDIKIKEIDSLKVEYNSWTLRDSNPDNKPIETSKKKGKEILRIAKDELELGGLPNPAKALEKKLKSLLSESQYEKFSKSSEERTQVLKSLNKAQLIEVLNACY